MKTKLIRKRSGCVGETWSMEKGEVVEIKVGEKGIKRLKITKVKR